LFDMHGNVREWCFDGQRAYVGEAVVDPQGAIRDSSRAVRGGSWIDLAGRARSAYRYPYDRVKRLGYIGFRVALKFKPSEGAERPGIAVEAG
jgi:formylglycine-generating enzyme required for sulfatase activity